MARAHGRWFGCPAPSHLTLVQASFETPRLRMTVDHSSADEPATCYGAGGAMESLMLRGRCSLARRLTSKKTHFKCERSGSFRLQHRSGDRQKQCSMICTSDLGSVGPSRPSPSDRKAWPDSVRLGVRLSRSCHHDCDVLVALRGLCLLRKLLIRHTSGTQTIVNVLNCNLTVHEKQGRACTCFNLRLRIVHTTSAFRLSPCPHHHSSP